MPPFKKYRVSYHICGKDGGRLSIVEEQKMYVHALSVAEAEAKVMKAEIPTSIIVNKTEEVPE